MPTSFCRSDVLVVHASRVERVSSVVEKGVGDNQSVDSEMVVGFSGHGSPDVGSGRGDPQGVMT